MAKRNQIFLQLSVVVGCGISFWIGRFTLIQAPQHPQLQPFGVAINRIGSTSVSALGTLQPVGEIHVLAGPMTQLGGAPRINSINVQEGEAVQQNQVLVRFDNASQVRAEIARVTANIQNKKTEIRILTIQTDRFARLVENGSFPIAEFEEKKVRLAGYEAQLQDLMGTLNTLNEQFKSDTVIRAPIAGVVLKVNSRVGERAPQSGVIELGNISQMQAVIQVDEADVELIRVGQAVIIKSENGAFNAILNGTVSSIGLKVARKRMFGRDPILDRDPEERVIDVNIALDPLSSQAIKHLTGVKVIAVIKTS